MNNKDSKCDWERLQVSIPYKTMLAEMPPKAPMRPLTGVTEGIEPLQSATAGTFKEEAIELRAALDGVFSVMDCRKALYLARGDKRAAAESLTNGDWMTGKLISWRHGNSLSDKAKALAAELSLQEERCYTVLKHCAGSFSLARRKLKGEPLLAE